MERKMVFIKVTTETVYTFDEGAINGWTTKQVIDDWFKDYPLDTDHATRDGHQIGNSVRIKKIQVMNERQEERQCKKVGTYFDRIKQRRLARQKRIEDEMKQWKEWDKIQERMDNV